MQHRGDQEHRGTIWDREESAYNRRVVRCRTWRSKGRSGRSVVSLTLEMGINREACLNHFRTRVGLALLQSNPSVPWLTLVFVDACMDVLGALIQTFQDGEVIFQKGDHHHCCYFVHKGVVRLEATDGTVESKVGASYPTLRWVASPLANSRKI